MHKLIYTLLVFSTATAFSSLGSESNYYFHAGPTLSSIYSQNGAIGSSRLGIFLGVGDDITLQDTLSLVGEVNFVQKGASNNTGTVSAKLDYLEIPLFVKLKVPGSQIRPFLAAGLAYGFAVGQSFVTDATSSPIESVLVKSEGSAQIAAGFEMTLESKSSLFFSGRYSHGLTNIVNTSTAALANESIKTRNFMFLVAFVFSTSEPEVTEDSPASDYFRRKRDAQKAKEVPLQ